MKKLTKLTRTTVQGRWCWPCREMFVFFKCNKKLIFLNSIPELYDVFTFTVHVVCNWLWLRLWIWSSSLFFQNGPVLRFITQNTLSDKTIPTLSKENMSGHHRMVLRSCQIKNDDKTDAPTIVALKVPMGLLSAQL